MTETIHKIEDVWCECSQCVSGIIYLSESDYQKVIDELNNPPREPSPKMKEALKKHGEMFGND